MTLPLAAGDLLALLAAIPLAALGGATFLKGVLGVAAWLRLPQLLVATTLAAFATSSPELAVSTLAALSGKPEIGLGDALGSNVVNVGLILGIALLLTLFALWLILVARRATSQRQEATASAPAGSPASAWLFSLAGLAALVLAGRLFVTGASGIAVEIGVQPYLIGVTVVAVGTSLPELVTVLLSRLRGHDDVGLGTLLGSNLFNGLAIVGVTAAIHPIRAPLAEVATALAFGVLTVLLMLPRAGMIARWRSLALLAAYGAFVFVTLAARP